MTERHLSPFLGWLGILRLGLVQASIGALVVVTTSVLNRVQVVELALPAVLPGVLVAIHYFVQVLRPRFGYGSDMGGRRTPWIIGGMVVLAAGALGATFATTLMPTDLALGVTLAVVSFVVVGLGVGACGTALLVLLSTSIAPTRLAAAATVTWVMMIAGFIVTTVVVGRMLDPFTLPRLLQATAVVAAGAFLLTCLAVVGIERPRGAPGTAASGGAAPAGTAPPEDFRAALREVWAEPHSRRLAGFVFVSMLAYSAQDLVLEPFAGAVFGLTPAQSTRLSGMQSSGVLVGMLLVAVICTAGARSRLGSLRAWTIGGCLGSALMLLLLALAGGAHAEGALRGLVFALGLANGAFAVAAIGSMMGLVGRGRGSREGTRMGLWGAAQAVAFGLGGILATGAVDLARGITGSATVAYGAVFVAEALLFVWATMYAMRLSREDTATPVDGSQREPLHDDALDAAASIATGAGRG